MLPQNPFALPYYSYQAMLMQQAYQNNLQQQPKVLQEQQKTVTHEIDLGEILGQQKATGMQQEQPQVQQQQQFSLTHFHHLPPAGLPLAAAPLPIKMQ